MSAVFDLLKEAQAGGLALRTEGDRLVIRGPRRLEPLARKLLEHKPQVIQALRYEVPDGWTRRNWIERLRYLAKACEPYVPGRAAELREWADGLERLGDDT
jgi:hypothetical protein